MSANFRVLGVIPARYASTRFPGKPLVDIQGQSMIQRVYGQAKATVELADVVVATDDERIYQHVEGFGGNVVMTSPDHPSGTDRCREAAEKAQGSFDAVVNIQGDEPFIQPEQIATLVRCFHHPETHIATLARRIDAPADLDNPNKVKVAIGANGHALYFSRYAVPFHRTAEGAERLQQHTYFRHIGLYGYRMEVLKAITELAPSPLEKAESLEQLRWMEHGYHIRVAETTLEAANIDTPADLQALLASMK